MFLSVIVTIYTISLFYICHYFGVGFGILFLLFGVIIIALIPVFQKFQKQKARVLIEKGCEKPFVNINKAPWYILEELPLIERVVAKRIVYIRRHYGNYTSIKDFFEKLDIKEQQQKEIEKIIFI